MEEKKWLARKTKNEVYKQQQRIKEEPLNNKYFFLRSSAQF
jgi:hypothetical protein